MSDRGLGDVEIPAVGEKLSVLLLVPLSIDFSVSYDNS